MKMLEKTLNNYRMQREITKHIYNSSLVTHYRHFIGAPFLRCVFASWRIDKDRLYIYCTSNEHFFMHSAWRRNPELVSQRSTDIAEWIYFVVRNGWEAFGVDRTWFGRRHWLWGWANTTTCKGNEVECEIHVHRFCPQRCSSQSGIILAWSFVCVYCLT